MTQDGVNRTLREAQMKAQIKANSKLIIEVEAEKETELFEGIATAEEVFTQSQCGMCKSVEIKYVVRKDDDDNKYYELHCKHPACRARLPFGVNKKGGGMYPKVRWDSLSKSENGRIGEQEKRKDEEEYAKNHFGFLPNGGWYKYKKEEKK